MLHSPYWFERRRVTGEARDNVPVNVGELVAQEFVVDLPGFIDLRDNFGDQIHFLHQLNPLCRSKLKELCGMTVKDYHCPAGEKLIVVEKGFRQSEIRNEMIVSWPGGLADLAGWVAHG
jgi:hypothetical protein